VWKVRGPEGEKKNGVKSGGGRRGWRGVNGGEGGLVKGRFIGKTGVEDGKI